MKTKYSTMPDWAKNTEMANEYCCEIYPFLAGHKAKRVIFHFEN